MCDHRVTTGDTTVAEALKRLDARGAELRNSLVWQIRDQVEPAARDAVKRFATALRDVATANDELLRLEAFERYDQVPIPVRSWRELSRRNPDSQVNRWPDGAQAAGWDI